MTPERKLSMQAPPADRLDALEAKLDRISSQLETLVDAQRPIVELTQEMGPIAGEVMSASIDQLAFLEERGYFAFLRELKYLVDRLVEDYDPSDLHELADNAANILDTVRTVTQPAVMAAVRDAADAFSEKPKPVGLFGAIRMIRKDKNIQRGLGFALDVVGRLGRAVSRAPRASRKELRAVPSSGVTPTRELEAPVPARVAGALSAQTIADETRFVPDAEWSRDVATTTAAELGVPELSEAHWNLVDFVRAEYIASGSTPNIRKITGKSGVATREIYSLFPRAPGKTLARIAGVPKPVGCL